MNFVLCTYIHCLCAKLAIYLVLHGASKILPCPLWYKLNNWVLHLRGSVSDEGG
jgi:hypothetical protein